MFLYKKCPYLLIFEIVYELSCFILGLLYNSNIFNKINLLNFLIIYKFLYNLNYYVEKLYFLINYPNVKIFLDNMRKTDCKCYNLFLLL